MATSGTITGLLCGFGICLVKKIPLNYDFCIFSIAFLIVENNCIYILFIYIIWGNIIYNYNNNKHNYLDIAIRHIKFRHLINLIIHHKI
jgi:hypothetical protein